MKVGLCATDHGKLKGLELLLEWRHWSLWRTYRFFFDQFFTDHGEE